MKTAFLSLLAHCRFNRLAWLILLACGGGNLWAQTATVQLNEPAIASAPVNPGMTHLELSLPVSAASDIRMQVIAPVSGVQFTLFDPDGVAYFQPGDVSVSFLDGASETPPLPGGVFQTPNIPQPQSGEWKVVLDFPAATEKTVVLATLFYQSDIEVGLILQKSTYRLGDKEQLGILVLNDGTPVTGLAPQLDLSLPGGGTDTLEPQDNGNLDNFDGLADDGLYSSAYTFLSAGRYHLEGHVTVPTPNGYVDKTAVANVDVTAPYVQNAAATANLVSGPGGCVAGVNIHVTGDVLQSATYSITARVGIEDGKSVEGHVTLPFSANDALAVDILIPSSDILDLDAQGKDYQVEQVDLISLQSQGDNLEYRGLDIATFPNASLSNLCLPPISITNNLTVTQNLVQGKIGTLNFSFPVTVAQAGYYTASFKITDGNGGDVKLVTVSPYLQAGTSTIATSLFYQDAQKSDGPFHIESVLIYGAGQSAQSSVVGASDPISRWQFAPYINGDLDGDGDVDGDDRALLVQFRNQAALQPGDRRDLTSDGVIDLRDVRYIMSLMCAQGSCPTH